MLFNSYEFIFLFLPITLFVFYQLGKQGHGSLALGWLVVASLFFYGWWNLTYLGLFIPTILINYSLGQAIAQKIKLPLSQRSLLILGIVFNLGLLGYFKYANFFLGSVNGLLGTNITYYRLILPLGISFITFEQIAYLVDTYKGKIPSSSLLDYCLFISFFPKLISGPIVRYKELAPQFNQKSLLQFNCEDLAVGLSIFAMGLCKKVIFADTIAPHATLIYDAITQGIPLTFFEAWSGVLAHCVQLYFDFSGYSDMAIGVGRMLGIKLPLNFDSPYKTVNLNQFWSRWHMSLTRFFRDYLYFPLSRWLKHLPVGKGQQTQQQLITISTLVTLTLTGLWHGAGQNFLLWGGLHGIFLVIYQQWRDFRRALGHNPRQTAWWGQGIGWLLTFSSWVFAIVLTKTHNVGETWAMWQAMLGFNGISLPGYLGRDLSFLASWGIQFDGLTPNFILNSSATAFKLSLLLLIVWFTPNTQQWMGQFSPALDHYALKISVNWQAQLWKKLQWQPIIFWSFISASLLLTGIFSLSQEKEFIYFQF